MEKRLLSNVTVIPVDMVIRVKPHFTYLWGPPTNGIKSRKSVKVGKHCSNGHLAGNILKARKSSGNTICRNMKSRLYCIHFLYEYIRL